jgi:hypothetical protein
MTGLLKKLFSKSIYTITYSKSLENFAVFHNEQGIVYVGERDKCVEFAKNNYH